MKNDSENRDFIKKCKSIDFSPESANQEKNLEILKSKLLNIESEREITMNKKMKKPFALVAVIATLLCLSMVVYGQDLVRIIKTVTLGDYAQYQVVEDLRESIPLPEAVIGQLFDKNGEVLTVYPEDRVMYDANGQEMRIYIDGDTPKAVTVEEYEEIHNFKTVDFSDLQEGRGYFICDILMPKYLPEGYSFKKVEFYADSIEDISADKGANKYMNIYYSDGKNEVFSMLRYMDEDTAFGSSASENIEKIKINGHEAIIDGNNLDVQIGQVMYMFFANEDVSINELVKIAESLE